MRRQGSDVLVAKADAAGADRERAGNALDDCRAPGAVAPDERHDFVGIDGDRDPAQDMGGAAEGVDVVDFEQHGLPRQPASGAPSRMLATSSLARISSGVPSARKAPSCIMTMRSE